MGKAINMVGGGGAKINNGSTIKFLASQVKDTFRKGDYVRYKANFVSSPVPTVLATPNSGSDSCLVRLSADRALLLYGDQSTSYLTAMVLTISENGVITSGTPVTVSTSSGYFAKIKALLLPNGNVFICDAQNLANAIVEFLLISVSGNSITVHQDGWIVDSTGWAFSPVLMPDGSVFIAHSKTSNYHLYGTTITFAGNSFTVGATNPIVTSGTNLAYRVNACLTDDGNVLIAHNINSSNTLRLTVVSVSGSSITVGTGRSASFSGRLTDGGMFKLPGGLFLLIWGAMPYSNDQRLYHSVITTSGLEVTSEYTVKVETISPNGSQGGSVANDMSSTLLSDGTVFTAHPYSPYNSTANYYLGGVFARIPDPSSIQQGVDTSILRYDLMGFLLSAMEMLNGNVLVVHMGGSFSSGKLCCTVVAKTGLYKQTGAPVDGVGVAKNSSGSGDVEVLVPY